MIHAINCADTLAAGLRELHNESPDHRLDALINLADTCDELSKTLEKLMDGTERLRKVGNNPIDEARASAKKLIALTEKLIKGEK